MRSLGLGERKLEYILWDRPPSDPVRSGKPNIVRKTLNDVYIADRIVECWPDARLIFLCHPAEVARSMAGLEELKDKPISRWLEVRRDARERTPTVSGSPRAVRGLTADSERVVRGICEFLGVPWEPRCSSTAASTTARSSWASETSKGRSRPGRVQPSRPPQQPTSVQLELRPVAEAWGYLPAGAISRTTAS